MKFTKEEKIFEIGEKIFPVDFSGFHKVEDEINGHSSLRQYELRDKLYSGIPLIVMSIPYQQRKMDWFTDEYFIEVVFEDDPETIYSTENTDTNVFKTAGEYISYVDDAHACSLMGY